MSDKKYEPCIICGYSHYTEKHHPDGKKEIFIIYDKETKKEMIYDLSLEEESTKLIKDMQWISNNGDRYISSRKSIHINPDNSMSLCANCHSLVHRRNMKIEEIRELYEKDNNDFIRLHEEMKMSLGKERVEHLKEWIIKQKELEKYVKERIGKLCHCGKKHYKAGTILHCKTYGDN